MTSSIIVTDSQDEPLHAIRGIAAEGTDSLEENKSSAGSSSRTFADYAGELERRKRKTEAKRRQNVCLLSLRRGNPSAELPHREIRSKII